MCIIMYIYTKVHWNLVVMIDLIGGVHSLHDELFTNSYIFQSVLVDISLHFF